MHHLRSRPDGVWLAGDPLGTAASANRMYDMPDYASTRVLVGLPASDPESAPGAF